MALGQVISLEKLIENSDDNEPTTLGAFLAAPELPEDPNAVTAESLFRRIEPGEERIIIILRSDGYTNQSISEITGLTEPHIRQVVATVRERLRATVHTEI